MRVLRTTLATDWPEELCSSLSERLIKVFLWFIPKANPDYEGKMHLVREWLIEFGDDDLPWREIGLDANGNSVLAGPSERNYGFWLDTNMAFKDFSGEPVDVSGFERLWDATGVKEPE